MALVGFQYEPVSLDVNEVCFEEEHYNPDTCEKSIKSQSVTEWCRCGKLDVMLTNVEYLKCGEVEALRCFQLSDTMTEMWSPKELVQQSCIFT